MYTRTLVFSFRPAVASVLLVCLSYILFAPFFTIAESATESKNYIVVLKDGASERQRAHDVETRHRSVRPHQRYANVINGFSAVLTESEVQALSADPDVAAVVEDREVSIDAISRQNLPLGVDRINAEAKSNTGSGVDVAILDTGIYSTHPDLRGAVVGGINCSASGSKFNTSDSNGHGTHVAGTIAARSNTVGVVGVAPAARLWAVKVLDNSGNGSWSSVICGLDFVAARAPAKGGSIKVVNMSLSGPGVSDNNCGNTNNDPLHKAICRVRDAGVTVIVAAGNNGANASSVVPAAYDDAVITVSALADTDGKGGGAGSSSSFGADDTFASFSNYGSVVDIAAPGVAILSTTLGSRYVAYSGTSMAAPHVAGAAALYLATHPSATWSEVKGALVSGAESIGNGHTDPSGKHPEPVLRADSL